MDVADGVLGDERVRNARHRFARSHLHVAFDADAEVTRPSVGEERSADGRQLAELRREVAVVERQRLALGPDGRAAGGAVVHSK
ncbi:MAG: hypothetical protein V9F06_03220 [Thermomicrobiales bacterium]